MPSGCVRRGTLRCGGCEGRLAQLVLDVRTTARASFLPRGGCNSRGLCGLLLG